MEAVRRLNECDRNVKRVPVEVVRAIVAEPCKFPLSWLLAAERRVSQTATEPPLAVIAESERWFGG